MKKKVKKARTTQTVRVEVVTPQNGQEHKEQAIVATGQGGVILGDNVEQALERAQRQMYFRNQLLKLIAKQINPRDIYVYVLGVQCLKCNGSVKNNICRRCGPRKPEEMEENLEPYLSGAGCRFVLSSAGAKFSNPEIIEKQYDGTEGPYIDFEVWVTVETADGRCVRTMGNNSTDDDFFAKRWRYVCPNCEEPTVLGYGESCAVHGKVKAVREAYYLSMQEVDIPAVKQKAMTNAWNHAVRDLGFMPNINHLKEAGVAVQKLRRIDFAKRQEDESESSPAAAASNTKQQPGKPAAQSAGNEAKGGAGKAMASPEAAKATNGEAQAGKAGQSEAPKQETTSQAPKAAQNGSSGVSQARIPVVVDFVKWTRTGSGLELTLDTGAKLYCFDNRKMGEDGEKLLDLLVNAPGKQCIFLTKKSQTTKGEKREFINITAALQIGDREWLEDGTPVVRRDQPSQREPGDE